jgi:hypothetical protein
MDLTQQEEMGIPLSDKTPLESVCLGYTLNYEKQDIYILTQ